MADSADSADSVDSGTTAPRFDKQYATLARQVIRDIAHQQVTSGADATEQARAYAATGKPDFVLAYLLECDLPDAEKRELYAEAHERRAVYIERKAVEFDRQFRRPFPLLRTEAAKDRALARSIRDGRSPDQMAGKQHPMI